MIKKQSFSIHSRFGEVINILDNTKNKSEFICEAIIFFYSEKKNLEEMKKKKEIKEMVFEIISEMNLTASPVQNIPIQDNSIPQESNQDDDDDDIPDDVISDWF